MSILPFKIKLKKEQVKSNSNSNSNSSSNNSHSGSSSLGSDIFNKNFFDGGNNNNNNNNNIKNKSDSENAEFNFITFTKCSSNIEQKDTKKKAGLNNPISNNSSYESKDITNIIEENNLNSFINFSKLKYLFINNNISNNKKNITYMPAILDQIKNFIIDKFSKPSKNYAINPNEIKLLRKIGRGGSSDIYLGMYRGTEIVEKRFDLKNIEKDITSFKREISSFIRLQHPYLLLFFGFIAEPMRLSIITEYCSGGNLQELLVKKKNLYLTWKLRKNILLQIALGMNYLHGNNPPILHRDLKSLNIFLTNDIEKSDDITDIKIADFGLSVFFDKDGYLNERVGTCHWMAPEVIKSQRYDTKADVYSYGIIIWEVCTRKTPYSEYQNRNDILIGVSNGKRPNINFIPKDTPDKFMELMIKCWDNDPDERPSFDDIINIIQMIDV